MRKKKSRGNKFIKRLFLNILLLLIAFSGFIYFKFSFNKTNIIFKFVHFIHLLVPKKTIISYYVINCIL